MRSYSPRQAWIVRAVLIECRVPSGVTMTATTAYPHIVKENGAPACLASHPRTRVAMIGMDYLARGLGPEDMLRHYPYLKLSEVHAAMAYYHDHQQEIDAE